MTRAKAFPRQATVVQAMAPYAFSGPESSLCRIQGKMVDMAVSHIYDAVCARLSSRRTARTRDDLDRAAARKSVTPRGRHGRTAAKRAVGGLAMRVRCHKGLSHASREGAADERCP